MDMLTYCMKVCLSLISSPSARNTVSCSLPPITRALTPSHPHTLPPSQVLSVIVRMYEELDTPDYISICQVSQLASVRPCWT